MAVAPTGARFKTLEFDGESSGNYGVYISGEAVYNAPERGVEMVSIPGRNGAFALDQGRFENIEITYPAGIFADTEADFAQAISDFRNLLCSKKTYCRLSDDYNPNEFRMAIYKSGLEVSPVQLKAGEFDIIFDCKPQRFLTSGETASSVASGSTINNPTPYASSPLIKVTGYGTLYIGTYPVAIASGASNPIYIDCDLMSSYEINSQNVIVNRNNLITLSTNVFPKIEPGNQTVTYSGHITAVQVTPRWWII